MSKRICRYCNKNPAKKVHRGCCSEICKLKRKCKLEAIKNSSMKLSYDPSRDYSFQAYLNRKNFKSEVWFLQILHKYDIKGFERNHPAAGFYLDFAFPNQMIAIEIDGMVHDTSKNRDRWRDRILTVKHGWKIIRIKHGDDTHAKFVASDLKRFLNKKSFIVRKKI